MTAAASAANRRPAKPRRSLAVPLGLAAFVVITWISVQAGLDIQIGSFAFHVPGINLNVGELLDNFTRGSGVLVRDFDRAGNPVAPGSRGLLQPNWAFLPETVKPMLETFQMAVIASVIGCALALPISFVVSRVTTPNALVFGVSRSVLSVIRAIPDILYALLFVAATSVGPLPGILALVFFNVGVMVKLTSETVDGVDPGPIEAGRASGASQSQTVRWGVLPQVLPNYVAYSLYTFELNIRASTVLGIVGAGGIGRILYREYGFFHWANVAVIIVELFVFVFVIELVSIWLRRRLV